MSRTVLINGLKYNIEQRNYLKTFDPIRTVNRGLTGATILQDFDEADSLNIKILVYRAGYAPDGTWGDEEDLETAYSSSQQVTITDLNESVEALWVWTSPLNYEWNYAISDVTAPFIVQFTVDKFYASGGGGP